jgi:hypothetical protein
VSVFLFLIMFWVCWLLFAQQVLDSDSTACTPYNKWLQLKARGSTWKWDDQWTCRASILLNFDIVEMPEIPVFLPPIICCPLCCQTGARILWMLVRADMEWTKVTLTKWNNKEIPWRWRWSRVQWMFQGYFLVHFPKAFSETNTHILTQGTYPFVPYNLFIYWTITKPFLVTLLAW